MGGECGGGGCGRALRLQESEEIMSGRNDE